MDKNKQKNSIKQYISWPWTGSKHVHVWVGTEFDTGNCIIEIILKEHEVFIFRKNTWHVYDGGGMTFFEFILGKGRDERQEWNEE